MNDVDSILNNENFFQDKAFNESKHLVQLMKNISGFVFLGEGKDVLLFVAVVVNSKFHIVSH